MSSVERILQEYGVAVRRRIAFLGLLAVALTLSVSLDLVTVPSTVGWIELWRGVFGGGVDRVESVLIWQIRFPQALMAMLVGASVRPHCS